MTLTRRHVMGAMGAGALFGWPGAVRAATEMTLGTARLTTLSDGHLTLPRDFMLGDLDPEKAAPILAEHGITGDMLEPPCNLTLYQDGTNTVLFDAGAGSQFMPSAGELRSALDAVGVAPDDISHVLFTHGHPDHLWGVLDDFDEPLFHGARHYMGTGELDYWRDPETVETIGAARQAFAVGAARRLDALGGIIETFDDGDEVVPGVQAVLTPGHTPGHMSFAVAGAMILGDAIGNHHMAFEAPGLPSGADQDMDLGIETRLALFDRIIADDMALIGFHLPAGGIGRAERAGGAYRFVPAG